MCGPSKQQPKPDASPRARRRKMYHDIANIIDASRNFGHAFVCVAIQNKAEEYGLSYRVEQAKFGKALGVPDHVYNKDVPYLNDTRDNQFAAAYAPSNKGRVRVLRALASGHKDRIFLAQQYVRQINEEFLKWDNNRGYAHAPAGPKGDVL